MASVTPDLTSQQFERLTVLRPGPDWVSPSSGKHKTTWSCRCACGSEVVVRASSLLSGRSQSCGCLHRQKPTKHGMYGTPTYLSWAAMIARCTRPNHRAWARYGGRGIKVCQRWRTFNAFYTDMGERPAGRSLDRIDNDGNYEPGNCRWATAFEQRHNRSDSPNYTDRSVTA